MSDSRYDVIVFGATSFVGQILCRYLLDHFGLSGELRWAAAGRSQSKLEALRKQLGSKAADLSLLTADAADESALRTLCDSTGVVVSTVGPYALYGEPLVKVCAETGTDYCDLTGEPQWIAQMLAKYEAKAKASGARIVHCCGFDSIPSDLGVYFLQQEAKRRYGQYCTQVKMRVKAIRGGFSGGTVASLLNAVKEATRDPKVRKELANPFSLCPADQRPKTRQPSLKFAAFDRDFKSWIAPFVMAAINSRIVQRSHALSGQPYTERFVYDEAMLTGAGLAGRMRATSMASGMLVFMAASATQATRWIVEKFVPAPGEGPTPEQQQKGFFDLRFHGSIDDGRSLRCKFTGDRDPGYGSTAKMLGQAAACLALDRPKNELPGGFWTPSTAMGEQLIPRLQAHAGIVIEVLERPA
ncbi:saccharopine dehydrogenase family protein [Pseudomarimonas arenosa]|uniref:Saccharopine dehydrogenase NADP-binding domain-containing protein n=1 Tax=Pseudomarimonas arenosa TaxID=2774145 RepID=A0AAW3ZNV8_9GAMM|nr:saccharopine dehydrogenase NADP-binding domain-containing protein [Pseudomarimonas arenosa]MBD8527791.1 saccharopine dehydrogenase NADP-binding domain-containing protein [Pseudomarimonas arenosa]